MTYINHYIGKQVFICKDEQAEKSLNIRKETAAQEKINRDSLKWIYYIQFLIHVNNKDFLKNAIMILERVLRNGGENPSLGKTD